MTANSQDARRGTAGLDRLDALVPRPDTETLVEWALEVLQPTPVGTVLDLGTGSGGH